MEKFALKVDLSAFFKNEFEKVMVLADMQWRTVHKAEKRVRKMFNIPCYIGFKSEEGFYIPSDEPIEILKHVPVLMAFQKIKTVREVSKTQVSEGSSNGIKIKEPIVPPLEFVHKKKRHRHALNDISFATSTPSASVAKKPKCDMDPITSNSNLDNLSVRISKTDGPLKKTIRMRRDTEPTKSNEIPSIENGSVRDVAEKSNANFSFGDNEGSTHPIQTNGQTNGTLLNSKNISVTKSTSRAHVFFNESCEEINLLQKNHKKETLFVCALENSIDKKARVFHIGAPPAIGNVSENDAKSNSNTIAILENITLFKENQSNGDNNNNPVTSPSLTIKSTNNALMREESEVLESRFEGSSMQSSELTESLVDCDASAVIVLNDTENVSYSINNTRNETNIESGNEASKIMNPFCAERTLQCTVDLKGVPKPLDTVAFKVKLTSGKISDYFVGRCTYVNKRTKSIKLELMDGFSQLDEIPPVFVCSNDDSIDLRVLNIKMKDMIEPKIFETNFSTLQKL